LSMNNVTPRGRYIYLDVETYLGEYEDAAGPDNAASGQSLPSTPETETA
jgi:hypothetical protein